MSRRRVARAAVLVVAVWATATVALGASFTVNSTEDAPDAVPGAGGCATAGAVCTLRTAVQEATVASTPTTIDVPAGVYTLGSPLDVPRGVVTILGADPATTTVDAAGAGRVFDVHGGATLDLQRLMLTHGSAVQEGGALRAYDAVLNLDTVTMSACAADGYGGGMFAAGSTVTVRASTFDQDVGLEGGAIAVMGGDITVVDSRFTDCLATDAGGALVAFGARSLGITGSTFTGNTAEHTGGAVYLSGVTGDATYTIATSTFDDNYAFGGSGGAIAADGLVAAGATGALAISGSTFTGNQADRAGGAISAAVAVASTGNTLTGNAAPDDPDVSVPVPSTLCLDATACDDHDGCTDDACTAGACVSTPKPGFEAVSCRLDAVDAALAAAAPTDLNPKWKAKLQRLSRGVRAKLQLAIAADQVQNMKKQRKMLKGTTARAKAMRKAITKGVHLNKVSATLGVTLQGLLGGGIDALTGLLSTH